MAATNASASSSHGKCRAPDWPTTSSCGTFTATGLNLAYDGGTPTFDLAVDAGSAVGNAPQVQLSYDCSGDGSWNRVETYRYFATDPVAGWEHYTKGPH
ncbi:hypothetical protein ABZX90_41685 [Streptomyces sp. NPDC002935]|uniref:hypothetical protein n=1 Tax=Streptomyces sp. NPDC002935 TaxID=3154545 RepID=UPI0033A4098B